jgi:hypothetical protein
VVEDHVEDDPEPHLVSVADEVDQVATLTKSRIDVEKVLHSVAVIGVLVAALLEDGAQP